jgi:drug/metabolite transporter (DMT)-like permease
LSTYPTSTVASFSFLTPVFGLILGWLAFGEVITGQILLAAFLVAVGIILINRRTVATAPAGQD